MSPTPARYCVSNPAPVGACVAPPLLLLSFVRALIYIVLRTRVHTHTHTHTHAHAHKRTHTQTHTHARAHTPLNTIANAAAISYAAAPINDLRWRPPQPAKQWDGVLNATEFGATCPQLGQSK